MSVRIVRAAVRLPGLLLLPAALLLSCAPRAAQLGPGDLDAVAERYVRLALALGRHDADYVDSFHGPEAWKAEAAADSVPLATISATADSLARRLDASMQRGVEPIVEMRRRFLKRQLEAMASRARLVGGEKMTFDQESQALYGVVVPQLDDASFDRALARLDSLLPGEGELAGRWEDFRRNFVIPRARLDTVFHTALREARRRTAMHFELPDSESFHMEFVTGQPWGAYNWYQGGYRSLIQINAELPLHLEQVLGLVSHEGYPGHHVNGVLLEHDLVRGRRWMEFTLLPLFAPQALIHEGVASVAEDVAFPPEERARFEKGVLCRLAGLDTSRYDRYLEIRAALDSLSLAGIEGARRWLDGRMTREEAHRWLMRRSVQTPERAERSLRFDERYRSYRVNYGMGERLVRAWLAANGGETVERRRWELLRELLSQPHTPADLGAADTAP